MPMYRIADAPIQGLIKLLPVTVTHHSVISRTDTYPACEIVYPACEIIHRSGVFLGRFVDRPRDYADWIAILQAIMLKAPVETAPE
jgi:hypothetical protein